MSAASASGVHTSVRDSGVLAVLLDRVDAAAVFTALRHARRSLNARDLPEVGIEPSPGLAVSSAEWEALAKAVVRAGFVVHTKAAVLPATPVAVDRGPPNVPASPQLPLPSLGARTAPPSASRNRLARFERSGTPPAWLANVNAPDSESAEQNGEEAEAPVTAVGSQGPAASASAAVSDPPAGEPVGTAAPPPATGHDASASNAAVPSEPAACAPPEPEGELLVAADPERTVLPIVGAQIHAGSVEAGQTVHAAGRDLIVSGGVAEGAEISADGSVHVYGPLCGRVAAGSAGDPLSRIYAWDFRAEVVCIGTHYIDLREHPAPQVVGCSVEVWLTDEGLQMGPLGQPPP